MKTTKWNKNENSQTNKRYFILLREKSNYNWIDKYQMCVDLRNDAVPAVTLSRAMVEYCWRARARCTAAVSSAEMLRTFTTVGE